MKNSEALDLGTLQALWGSKMGGRKTRMGGSQDSKAENTAWLGGMIENLVGQLGRAETASASLKGSLVT